MRRILFLVLALALLASCVKLERQPVDKRFYSLDVVRAAAPPSTDAPPVRGTLLVRRVHMSPRCAGRELVYRMGESNWTADYYNTFFVSPADMLSQDLRAWLAASRLYANVVDSGSLVEPELILEGNVTSLHGDFSARPAQAVVEMQFLLLQNAGAEHRVLLTRDVRRTAPLAGNTPQELVRALRSAVTDAFTDLESALRSAPRK